MARMIAINHPTISISEEVVRPTYAEINLDRLTANYRAIEKFVAPAKIMPILKANAYGHGLIQVARHVVDLGASYLGVAVLEEGILLREAGITVPILVLGGILGNQVPIFLKHNLTLTASSVEKLVQVDEAAAAMGVLAKVHLKIDTGMERLGVHYYSAETLLAAASACQHCQVEGIFSHFANADSTRLHSAQKQLRRFKQVLEFYEKRDVSRPPMRHMANSGATLQIPASHLDMVRVGILLFGVYPSNQVTRTIQVQPALSWKSRVVYFKVVKPNHPVSYGSTWQSDHMVRVVTIPVGYGDGYFRGASGKAQVIIRGHKYPVIGRICMDQMMVNIEWETAYNDDEVILIGQAGEEIIRVEDLADWAGTIPYEVLTNINTRVPRVYVQDPS